jgi:hypothetical protein
MCALAGEIFPAATFGEPFVRISQKEILAKPLTAKS